MSMDIRQLTDQPRFDNVGFAVVLGNEQKISQANIDSALNIPENKFVCTRLLTKQTVDKLQQACLRRVKIANESQEVKVYNSVEVHFTAIIQDIKKLGGNAERPKILLQQFVSEFIPVMQQNPIQLRAELENLEHIRSCAAEMLKPVEDGGLGFRSEFVSQIVCKRLQIAMFGFNDQHVVQVVDVKQMQQIVGKNNQFKDNKRLL